MDAHPFLSNQKLAYIDEFLNAHAKFFKKCQVVEPELAHEDSIEPKFQSLINDTRELLEVSDGDHKAASQERVRLVASKLLSSQLPVHVPLRDVTSRPRFHAPAHRTAKRRDIPEAIREPCQLLKSGTARLPAKRVSIPRCKVPNQLGIYNKGKRSSTIQVSSKYSQPGSMPYAESLSLAPSLTVCLVELGFNEDSFFSYRPKPKSEVCAAEISHPRPAPTSPQKNAPLAPVIPTAPLASRQQSDQDSDQHPSLLTEEHYPRPGGDAPLSCVSPIPIQELPSLIEVSQMIQESPVPTPSPLLSKRAPSSVSLSLSFLDEIDASLRDANTEPADPQSENVVLVCEQCRSSAGSDSSKSPVLAFQADSLFDNDRTQEAQIHCHLPPLFQCTCSLPAAQHDADASFSSSCTCSIAISDKSDFSCNASSHSSPGRLAPFSDFWRPYRLY